MGLPAKVLSIIDDHVNRGDDYDALAMLDEVGQYINVADYRSEVLSAALVAIKKRTIKNKKKINRNYYILNGLLVLGVLIYLVLEARWLGRALGWFE